MKWILLLFPLMTFAGVPKWHIVPEKSQLTFTAIQNNAPVTGRFKSFSGDIEFDPDQLDNNRVRIVVQMDSVYAEYEDLVATLKEFEWFAVKKFPEAIYEATKFTKIKDNEFEAQGTLTIRDYSLPINLTFSFKEYSDKNAIAKGKADLKRLAFGVGQGEWQSTEEVKDEVSVEFEVFAHTHLTKPKNKN